MWFCVASCYTYHVHNDFVVFLGVFYESKLRLITTGYCLFYVGTASFLETHSSSSFVAYCVCV
jgi:hypothetical protein